MNFKKQLFILTVTFLLTVGQAFAVDFYWVGNSGSWNDASHWASKSGGFGGFGIPSSTDNVIIDNNSFKIRNAVIVIPASVSVNDINIISSDGSFTIKADKIVDVNIFGSVFIKSEFKNEISASLRFKSTEIETVYLGWFLWMSNIYFEGTGTYKLTSPIQNHKSELNHVSGTLDLNNNDILCGSFISNSNLKRKLVTGQTTILAYDQFHVEDKKNDYDLSKTTVYFLGEKSQINASLNKSIAIIQNGSNVESTNKTVTSATMTNDTVSCGNVCDGVLSVSFTTTCPTATVDWLPGLNVSTFPGECHTCPIPGPAGTSTIFNMCPGLYTAVVRNSCDASVVARGGEVKGHLSIVPIAEDVIQTTCKDTCDGSIFIAVSGADEYAIWEYQWMPGTPADTNDTYSNLCAGIYAVEVKDGFGCIDTFIYNVPEPDFVYPNITVTDVICYNDCDGTATANPSGGNGGYTYQWSANALPNVLTNPGIINLCVDNYSLNILDVKNCPGDTVITVFSPDSLDISSSQVDVSCGGYCNGSASAVVNRGGVSSYTHNWSTGFTETLLAGQTSTINLLCAGTYTNLIVDANGCDTLLTFIITEPDTLMTNTIYNNVKCFSACDGNATTVPFNGTAPYSYSWSCGPSTFDSIVGLCPGQCIVTVTDFMGCIVKDTITITEPLLLEAFPSVINAMSCPTVCDGVATANPTGGTTPYSYLWSNTDSTPTTTTGLCQGYVIVTVTDSNMCVAKDSVLITEPVAMVLNMNSTDVTCNGFCDGTGGVTIVGGALPYSYNWVPAPPVGQGTNSISGLCPNNYTVTVTDGGGCSVSNNINITQPLALTAAVTTVNLRCNNLCEGIATVNFVGGTAPYMVSWDGGAFIPVVGLSNTITNICAGNHNVDIRDAKGCIMPTNFVINEPTALTTVSSVTNLVCNSACSGIATSNPVGGTSPYVFSWNSLPTQNNQTATNLCAGIYIVTITDDSLCVLKDTVTIIEPDTLKTNVLFSSITCNNLNNGTATALPTGGSPGYTIVWNTVPAGVPLVGNPINFLSAGQYFVSVTDAANCVTRDTVTITNPSLITVNPSAISASCETFCDGVATANPTGGTGSTYSFAWCNGDNTQTTTTGLCAGKYCIVVTDSIGCSVTDSVTILPSIVINIITDTVNISCNGLCDGQATANPSGGITPYTFLWDDPIPQIGQTAIGLCQGLYTVVVTDSIGCKASASVLMPVDPSVLQANGTFTNVTCYGANDGTISAAPTGGSPPYILAWSTTPQTGLGPGKYWVTVTDANNCSVTDTLNVLTPDSISLNPVISHVNCNGNAVGNISLFPSGGTPGYTYLWSGGLGTNSSISNLVAGFYSVTVKDTLGCNKLMTYEITQPSVFSSNPLVIPETCSGSCDGAVGIIITGGTPPHSTTWSNASTTDTISNLCASTYSAISVDANNCSTSQTIVLNSIPVLAGNISGTSIECNGGCSGTAAVAPTGGTGPYNILWTSVGGSIITNPTNQSISNLCADTYSATITDANNCTTVVSYNVTDPMLLVVTLDSTNITCPGNNNGTAIANPVGGTPPYVYSWTGGNLPFPTTTQSISNLIGGIYTVSVVDSNGCSFLGSVNIIDPLIITPNENVVGANCGFNDGSITLIPTGGTPPYNHSWSNGASGSFIGSLAAGFYTDTIIDFNGCKQIFTFAVSNPTGPSGVTTTIKDASCFGSCDGAANVIPIGGTPGYTYDWNIPGQNDSTIINQCSGTLNLTITDAINCFLNTFVIIGQADSISANSTFTNVSCSGNCDGTARVTPNGGTAPYTFLWSNLATSSSVTGLCLGPISVTITDANGCSTVVNFNITSPNILTVLTSSSDVLCNSGSDGTATASPSDGTSPYFYLWSDPLSQTSATATGLAPGSYTVIVKDVNGCSSTNLVVINQPNLISANSSTTLAACTVNDGTATVAPTGGVGPYTYLWTASGVTTPNINGLSAGTYTVEITDFNSCKQSFLIPISNLGGPNISINSVDASCNGLCSGTASVSVVSGTPNYTYLWNGGGITGQTTTSVTGLCAGIYTTQVTDGNGCKTVRAVIIGSNSAITASVATIPVSCKGSSDGSVIVVPSGGLPPYSYVWSGPCPAPNNNAVAGLCAGSYTVTVSDAGGCSSPINVVITEPNVLSVSVVANNQTCFGQSNGSATATPSGGNSPYTYLWSNGLTTPTISGVVNGNYSVTITDIKGCSTVGNVTIFSGNEMFANVVATHAACGSCNGSATINVVPGAGPYTYLWLPINKTTKTVNNLCPGAYTVQVTNAVGCMQPFFVIISNPTGPAISSASDSTSCFGSCDGSAWTTVTSGISPFIYQWNDNLLQTTDTATALCAGLYNIVVQDSVGCISVDSIRVDEPVKILANFSSTVVSCNSDCDATATVNPSGGIGTYIINWSNGDVGPNATNLCAGNHSVTITDDNSCSTVYNFTITSPSVLTNNLSATSTTCNADCDGTLLTTVVGGSPPYIYSWNSAPVQTNSLATNLCSGLYTVTVTDTRGCIQMDTISVVSPPVLSTSSIVSPVNCNGQNDGSITTNPNGGVPPYNYIWSTNPVQFTQTAVGLAAGTYNVVVVDSNGCTAYDTLIVTEPIPLNDSTIVNGPTCGICDGSATANPVGGVGPYLYLWGNGDNTQTTTTGLCAGILSVQITDLGTGCIYNFNVIVNSVTGPDVVVSFTGESCPGACDGTALASASNGNLPYSFLWSPSGITDSLATGLCANFYTVTVTDAIGCITIDTVTIEATGLMLSITNLIPESCFSACDGSATVVASSGLAPYSYQWNPLGGNNDVATNLCSGGYMAIVTDALNCKDSIGTVISGPNILNVSIAINTAISCNSICNGALIASPLGGNTPYSYLWSDGQTTPIASNLCAGTYSVLITDANGCSVSKSFTITEPSIIVANETLSTPACNVCNGQIQLNPSGGVGPYTFLWGAPISPQNTATVVNLCADVYSVTITDFSGCSNSFLFPLSNTNAPDPNVINTPVTCNGSCNGSLVSNPIGGSAPYTYVWSPNAAPNNLFNPGISNLCPNIFTVDVTDVLGCIGISIDTIVEPSILLANISSSNVTCNGSSDGWAVVHPSGGNTPYNVAVWVPGIVLDSLINLSANTYYVTVTDALGCSVLDSVTITEPALITANAIVTDASCSSVCDGQVTLNVNGGFGPYTFSWTPGLQITNPAINLCYGSYVVTITDQNNCSVLKTILVGSVDTVVAIAPNDTSICAKSTLDLVGSTLGNVNSVQWYELPGMNVISNTNTASVTSLVSGTFCYVFEAIGICISNDTICVTYNPLPIANAGFDVSIVEEGSTVLNGSGGGTYIWTPSIGLSDTTIFNPIATPTITTTYYLTVTSIDGCLSTDSVIVTVIPTIHFPDGITPNGDGKNDTWVIDYLDQYPGAVVEIYNRWGELLFRTDNYKNDWNGTYNGENLPVGTYYYVIELNDGKTKPFTGPLTVLR